MLGALILDVKVKDATFNFITGSVKIVLSAAKSVDISSVRLLNDNRIFELNNFIGNEPGHVFTGYVPYSVSPSEKWIALIRVGKRLIEREISFRFVPELVRDPEIVLSICIPTYHRASRVVATVQNILKCPLQNIEVVVCDNASPDDTVAQLHTINDPRLKIYVNERNFGPIPNFNLALAYGRGDYVLLHSDEDIILTETLEDFTAFLKANDGIGAGTTSVGSRKYNNTTIYNAGKESLIASSVGFTYMGGFFYKRSLYDIMFLFQEYGDPAFLYPFEVITWALARKAGFCTYAPAVVKRGQNDVSFFPKSNNRHFGHPVNLIAQYFARCRYFKDLAKPYLDQNDFEAARARFQNLLTSQNFSMCYTISLADKLELLHLLAKDIPALIPHKVIQSTIAHAVAEMAKIADGDECAELERAVAIDPENTIASFRLADLLRSRGAVEEEERLYAQIVSNTPRKWQYMLRLIGPLRDRKRTAEIQQVKAVILSDRLVPQTVIEQMKAL